MAEEDVVDVVEDLVAEVDVVEVEAMVALQLSIPTTLAGPTHPVSGLV
jgi:hypothetical protein